jgi:hypothetical protein
MSLDLSGGDQAVKPAAVTISVTKDHPLIKLANALPWALLIALVMAGTSLRMNDKQLLLPMAAEHAAVFGEGSLKSVSADKGYWSARNQRGLIKRGVLESGRQRPANIKSRAGAPRKSRAGAPRPEAEERLRNRRAGIEALISRTKHGGQLGRSRMKSDAATLAAGYASVLGFNLRQLSRKQRSTTKQAA